MNKSKSMFEKYEYEETRAQHLPEYKLPIPKDSLVGTLSTDLLKDIKGNEIGVKVTNGSAFSLYFTFDGKVEDGTLSELLADADFGFELRDVKHNILLTLPVTMYPEDHVARVDLVSEKDGTISYGNYYIYLYMLLDGTCYTLFDEWDGVVSIE